MDLMGLQFLDDEILAMMSRFDPDCSNDIDYMRVTNPTGSSCFPHQ